MNQRIIIMINYVIWCGDLSCTTYSASYCTRNDSRICCRSTTHWVLEHTAEHGYSCHSQSRPVYKSPCASVRYPNWLFRSLGVARDWSFSLAQDSRIVRTISSRCSSMGMTCTVGKDDRIHRSNLNPGRWLMWSIPNSTSLSGPGSGFCTVVVITALHQNSQTARNSSYSSLCQVKFWVYFIFHSIAVSFHNENDANADVMTCDVQTNAPCLRWGKTVEPTAITAAITSCSQNARHEEHSTSDCHGHVEAAATSTKHPRNCGRVYPLVLWKNIRSCPFPSVLWELCIYLE